MDEQLQVTLKDVAKRFNEANIAWGLGGSALLDFFRLDVQVQDLDLMVEACDFEEAVHILNRMGYEKPKEAHPKFKTAQFTTLIIDQSDVDIMSGLCVNWKGSWHTFEFTRAHVGSISSLDDVSVPLMRVEDWYVFYHWLERPDKISVIEYDANRTGIALDNRPTER